MDSASTCESCYYDVNPSCPESEIHSSVSENASLSNKENDSDLGSTLRYRCSGKQDDINTSSDLSHDCYGHSQCSDTEVSDIELIFPLKNILPIQPHEIENLLQNQSDNDPISALLDPHGLSNNLSRMPGKELDQAEELARRVWEAGWTVVHHTSLPKWLRDNECLVKGHRPPLNSIWACMRSVFRVHTETGNIWTHLLGFIAFLFTAIYFMLRPSDEIQAQEKIIFSAYFIGATFCLGFSWTMHTMICHSYQVAKICRRLDYCGIALLIMGSFVPWLYYSFYCRNESKIAYLILIFVLGIMCVIVSMLNRFAQPKFRPVRAGMFIGLGLSGLIPALHYIITDGFYNAIENAALGWLSLMALLYITGALIYALRFPERVWPGKFDIWFQSHQIFHVFVIFAAYVHYHGISIIAANRLTMGDCIDSMS